jgi:hypothetical protein
MKITSLYKTIHGNAALAIAHHIWIFNDDDSNMPKQPQTSQATVEDMRQYVELGQSNKTIKAIVRVSSDPRLINGTLQPR